MKLAHAIFVTGLLGQAFATPTSSANLAVVLIEQQNPALKDTFYNTTVKVPIDQPANSPVTIVEPKLLSRFYLVGGPASCAPLFDTVPATKFETIVGNSFTLHASAAPPQAADALNQAKLRFWCTSSLSSSDPQVSSSVHANDATIDDPAARKNLGMNATSIFRRDDGPPDMYDQSKCPPEQGPIGAIQDCDCFSKGLNVPKDDLMSKAREACDAIKDHDFGRDHDHEHYSGDFVLRENGGTPFNPYDDKVQIRIYYRGEGPDCTTTTYHRYSIPYDTCVRAFDLMIDGCSLDGGKSRGTWAVDTCFLWVLDPNGGFEPELPPLV